MMRWLILLLFLALGLIALLFPRSSDERELAELLSASGATHKGVVNSKQERTGILKEGWIAGHYVAVAAPRSSLYVIGGGKDAIEELYEVKAYEQSQDPRSPRTQRFTGDRARFFYQRRTLIGSKVHYSDECAAEPLITGIAEELKVALHGDKMDLCARGIVASGQARVSQGTLRITSKEAHYDRNRLILEGDVVIEDCIGQLKADRAELYQVDQREITSTMPFSSIHLTGCVAVTFNGAGTLYCSRIEGDLVKRHFQFSAEPHVRYVDDEHELSAERGELYYTENGAEKGVEISEIHLYDEVQLVRRPKKEGAQEGASQEGASKGCQYALADRVDYYPKERRTLLEGTDSRVLFVDEERGATLSARTIVMRGDCEAFHGIGEVEMRLREEEIERLMHHFPLRSK